MLVRFKFICGAFLAVAFSCGVAAQPRPNWMIVQGSDESELGLTKLLYSEIGQTESELYLRCEADDGWIFLIHDYTPKVGNPPIVLRVGDLEILPSFRTIFSSIDDTYYIDAAIPADHKIFQRIAEGYPIKIEENSFVASTAIEKRVVKSFIEICDSE